MERKIQAIIDQVEAKENIKTAATSNRAFFGTRESHIMANVRPTEKVKEYRPVKLIKY